MATTPAVGPAAVSSEDMEVKAVRKRYEGLVMVRSKAIKGKGAWYWAHLEPILVNNSDTGLPKAVKLRCSLCDAVFSASNPSRTASEHLKRGTCANFSSAPKPISSVPPAVSVGACSPKTHNHRKRASISGTSRGGETTSVGGGGGESSSGIVTTFLAHQPAPPLAIVDPTRFAVDLAYPPPVSVATHSAVLASSSSSPAGAGGFFSQHQPQHLVLSGGKDDLGPLAKLEDSVKRLKSPKTSPGQTLAKAQMESALDFLADWVFECCGSVSFSSLEHPKFKAFLNQVGLPAVSSREFAGSRLDAKYSEAKAECEAKIRDAMFFQISSDGWKSSHPTDENLVHLSLILPNGASVFRRVVFCGSYVPSRCAEEILWDTITEICGSAVHQCVGIVSDRFKGKALKNLENQHNWMINLCCQYQGFISLIKDFSKELPLFKSVTENCLKLACFFNTRSRIRHTFCKYQLQEYGRASLLRAPSKDYAIVEDILSSARALQLVLLDESFKATLMEESTAREIEEMMRNPHFWNEMEAVHSLVKLIKTMAQEIETEKPRIGQCLPMWEELRVKVRDWCSKFDIVEAPVEKVLDKRFKRNYHPAWAAAFILDPLYLIRDTSGKYLPPFKCLTPEQEKDVDKLITRLVSRDEAHIALMELMKWRTEGLDPVYAQAVQLKQRDPNTGKMKIANPQSSRLVWETYMTDFSSLGKVAVRLIFLQATSSSFKCSSSLLRWVNSHSKTRIAMEKAQKLIFISAHSKWEKRGDDEQDKEAEILALANGEDDVLNEVFVDTSSV